MYSLQEDKSAKVIRISNLDHKNVMHLNLYENHFSYITKFKSFAKKYRCTNCGRLLTKACHLKQHMQKCNIEISEVYCGGKYRNRKNLFENLESVGINVPKEIRGNPYVVCYDFEALQVPIDDTLQGRKLHFEHVVATVSICSNVSDHTQPVHLRSYGDPQQLCDSFVEALVTIQTTKERVMTETFREHLTELEQSIENLSTDLGENQTTPEEVSKQSVQPGTKKKIVRAEQSRDSKRSFLDDDATAASDIDDNDDDEYRRTGRRG